MLHLRKNAIKRSLGDNIFDALNVVFFILCSLLMIIPFWNVVVISFIGLGEFM